MSNTDYCAAGILVSSPNILTNSALPVMWWCQRQHCTLWLSLWGKHFVLSHLFILYIFSDTLLMISVHNHTVNIHVTLNKVVVNPQCPCVIRSHFVVWKPACCCFCPKIFAVLCVLLASFGVCPVVTGRRVLKSITCPFTHSPNHDQDLLFMTFLVLRSLPKWHTSNHPSNMSSIRVVDDQTTSVIYYVSGVPQEGIPAVLQGTHWLLLSHWRHLHWIMPLLCPGHVLNIHSVLIRLVLHIEMGARYTFVGACMVDFISLLNPDTI